MPTAPSPLPAFSTPPIRRSSRSMSPRKLYCPLVRFKLLSCSSFLVCTALSFYVLLALGANATLGIGNSTLLQSLNITTLVDLPGVGENLQVCSSESMYLKMTGANNFGTTGPSVRRCRVRGAARRIDLWYVFLSMCPLIGWLTES